MQQLIKKISFAVIASALLGPVSALAQEEKKDKEKDKKEAEQIIITRKNPDEKVTIEVNGDKVLVNGKSLDENPDGDVKVSRHKIKDVWAFGGEGLAGNWGDNFSIYSADENRAMLGVTTEQDNKGAQIQTITKAGGAEKAGLKKDDIITKINEEKIDGPDDLSKTIRSHKPGDKVTVTFLRDGKEQKLSAELGKYKGVNLKAYNPGQQYYKMDIPEMDLEQLPRLKSMPRIQGQNWSWSGGSSKLGLFVQDTEDGKGVKVIDVDGDGNASKAGIKEDDVLTEVDGKAVNSADDVAKIVKESKDKASIKFKLLRKGKTENIEVKIPKKLKTADL